MNDTSVTATPIDALFGVAALSRALLDRDPLLHIHDALQARLRRDPNDACALQDLSIIQQLLGNGEGRRRLQQEALRRRRLYSVAAPLRVDAPRLLAIVTPGDFMSNTPLEFLVEDGAVALDLMFLSAGDDFPAELPEHDVTFVAIAEGDHTRPVLARIEMMAAHWPQPLLNAPAAIARLTRDGAWRLLADAPGLVYPFNAAAQRGELEAVARGETSITTLMGGAIWPIIARPRGAHAGDGLEKLDSIEALADFLARNDEAQFYLARFVDYRSADGLYRKYRIVFIDGIPYAAHLAISRNWMIHYLNADMHEDRHRAEEARFFAEFENGFAHRHTMPLAELSRRVGLDYFVVDCGETSDGRLLMFEIGAAMIVHALDSDEAFPYKKPQMRKVCAAFAAMVRRRAQTATRAA